MTSWRWKALGQNFGQSPQDSLFPILGVLSVALKPEWRDVPAVDVGEVILLS